MQTQIALLNHSPFGHQLIFAFFAIKTLVICLDNYDRWVM
jgi:hypothetical protein